jgi:hypothetical protein
MIFASRSNFDFRVRVTLATSARSGGIVMRFLLPITIVSALAGALFAAGPPAQAGGANQVHKVVVRPVTAAGTPSPGWQVTRERGSTVSCAGAAAAAVSNDIVQCFPAVEYLPSCWTSHHHTVLCLRDATRHQLVRIRYTGSIDSVAAPKHPSPQDMRLTGGQKCEIRVGGAWAQLPTHPHWDGFYSCHSGDVYGPAKGDGIVRGTQPWTVRIWTSGTQHHVVLRQVGTAYFVGTRHA